MYHVGKIFRLSKIAAFICNIVLAMVLLLLAKPMENAVLAIHVYGESSYKYLGDILDNGEPVENSYYANIGYISFYTDNNDYLICDNLMMREGICYGGNYLTRYHGAEMEIIDLSKEECAISANLAESYHIHVNDYINIRINFKEYIVAVKYIFEPYYGLKKADIFTDMGLVVLGYNENIVNDAVTYDIVCFSENSIFFENSDISIKGEIVSELKRNFYFLCALLVVIAFAICFLVNHFCSDNIRNDVLVLQRIGLSCKRVLKYNLLDALYKYLLIYTIPLFLLLIYSCCAKINCIYEMIVVLLCFCVTVLCSVIRIPLTLRRR